jgi:3-hydroxybutyrate dehydrogenase
MRLHDRTAVVTGGGQGIGAAVAERLARAGAAVVVAARAGARIEAVAARLRDEGLRGAAIPCDVTDPASVEALFSRTNQAFGPVEILINNAGASSSAPLHRLTLDEWNRLLAVNATGPFLCTRACLPGMVERGWGRVVNVASVAGLRGGRYIAAYAASKHAVVGLTRSVALEVAGAGVTVNAVCPGFVDTPMTTESVARIVEKTGRTEEEALRAIASASPQRRLLDPEEVAHAVLFLCHEDARGVNGECVVLDGGGTSG